MRCVNRNKPIPVFTSATNAPEECKMENESSPNIIGTLCTIQRLGGASGFAAAWFYILCEDAVGEFWVISGHKDRNVGEWYDAYWIPQTGKNDPRVFIEQHPDQIHHIEVTKEYLIAHGVKV